MSTELKSPAASLRYYTFAEMKEENRSADKSLIVVQNSVYDVNGFLREHPGGELVITEHESKDATGAFFAVGHSSEAKRLLAKYKVGELVHSERLLP